MSNARKNKLKMPWRKKAAPRVLPEIHREYNDTLVKAGQLQYQIGVYSEDLERINQQLRSLNYEAAARNELDKKSAPKQDKEVTDVSQS